MRLFCAVLEPHDSSEPQVTYFQFADDEDPQPAMEMPKADVIILHEIPEGYLLDGYTLDGEVAGDTLHLSLEDAKEFALDRYHGMISDWQEIPEDLDYQDAIQFAIRTVKGDT